MANLIKYKGLLSFATLAAILWASPQHEAAYVAVLVLAVILTPDDFGPQIRTQAKAAERAS